MLKSTGSNSFAYCTTPCLNGAAPVNITVSGKPVFYCALTPGAQTLQLSCRQLCSQAARAGRLQPHAACARMPAARFQPI
jgi:hypothetical protein